MISPDKYICLGYHYDILSDDTVHITNYTIEHNNQQTQYTDFNEMMSALLDYNKIVVYVCDLALFYQLHYDYFYKNINRKSYVFFSKFQPLYFRVKDIEFRSVEALSLKSFDELKNAFETDFKDETAMSHIPTSTAGTVRNDLKRIIRTSWRGTIERINNMSDTTFLSKAYSGGDGGKAPGKIKGQLYSFDITSSYPAMLYYKQYPAGSWSCIAGNKVHESDLRNPFIITATFYNIEYSSLNKSIMDHWVEYGEQMRFDKKRLVSAKSAKITCTSLDFDTIKNWYTYDKVDVECIYVCSKWERLPEPIRAKVKQYFINKKDAYTKRKLNIIYGVFCQDPNKPMWHFPDDNRSPYIKDSLFPFQVGVFCSAYARKRLNNLLFALKDTACYWDTDCVKGYVSDMDTVYQIVQQQNDIMKQYYADDDDWRLGQWKDEGVHEMTIFTLKQYIKDGEPTCAGPMIDWDIEHDGYCQETTVFPKSLKTVQVEPNKVRIKYNDFKFADNVFMINHY